MTRAVVVSHGATNAPGRYACRAAGYDARRPPNQALKLPVQIDDRRFEPIEHRGDALETDFPARDVVRFCETWLDEPRTSIAENSAR
jgi:hypothetical protein